MKNQYTYQEKIAYVFLNTTKIWRRHVEKLEEGPLRTFQLTVIRHLMGIIKGWRTYITEEKILKAENVTEVPVNMRRQAPSQRERSTTVRLLRRDNDLKSNRRNN